MSKFTVDTHLFRELGQLLVGRDSTALIELVKNAYDADADEVVVFGRYLDDPDRGIIRIQDTGIGMNPEQFSRGFLRIASRMKDEGVRLSLRYQRRYTGAKGIGRLAAHKLAKRVEIESIPFPIEPVLQRGVCARINWDAVELAETLDQISENAVSVSSLFYQQPRNWGTLISLSHLRQRWTPHQLGIFLSEVESFQPPRILVDPLPESLTRGKGLFRTASIKRSDASDPGFAVRLEGDFAGGESYWPAVAQTAHWLLEIDASPNAVKYAVIPLTRIVAQHPGLQMKVYEQAHPNIEDGPFFQARILVREGATEENRAWSKRVAGVRVFMEGFRVLPYGEPSNDWLQLERDNTDRDRKLNYLNKDIDEFFPAAENEGLLLLPNKHYFGAVFLKQDCAPKLAMLVNREGFIPDESYDTMQKLVRRGIDLLTRVRASARTPQVNDKPKPERKLEIENAFSVLEAGARDLRLLATSLPSTDARRVNSVIVSMERAAKLSKEYFSSERMMRVLASVGLQLAAFIHEMNTVLNMAQTIEASMTRVRNQEGLPTQGRTELGRLLGGVGDLRRTVERQAAHLTDVVTPDARRRRSRHNLRERFQTALRFVSRVLEERNIDLQNEIDSELRSPPMFAAELTTVFTNLLTNAVKAAGSKGKIRASGEVTSEGLTTFRLENTGTAVELREAERWFRPFESTTTTPDPVLGQGMGLGLSITRDILAEIGASISFVQPRRGYATAIQITFPK